MVHIFLLATLLVLALNVVTLSAVSTCKTILISNRGAGIIAPSGVYNLTTISGTRIMAYCEMGLYGGGFTFIDPQYLPRLTAAAAADLQSMFTDTTTFLMRVRKTDGTQPYITLSQLSQYRTIPLKLGLSESNLYVYPTNAELIGLPFLYFGFLPVTSAANNNQQGLRANGKPITFNNCDKNPSSHITLYTNFAERPPTTYAFADKYPFCNSLFEAAIDNPSARVMPPEFFMFTELAWGGCGCFSQTDARLKPLGVLSTTIGFR